MVQLRVQSLNLSRSTDAFPLFGPEKQRREADGSPPPGGCPLTSQHSPTYDSALSQETPPSYSSSTRNDHHSSSSAKKIHPPSPTSAKLEEPARVRNRSDSSRSGTSVRPAETSGSPLRSGRPVATGPTNTMAQPRLQMQSSTSATDALLSQNTPARGTTLGGAVERGAAKTPEDEGPQPSYNTNPN